VSEPFVTPPLTAIGIVRTAQVLHHQAPRQSGLGRGATGVIEVRQGLQNGLHDLDGFSHVWVVAFCHLARGARLKVQPPRDGQKRGVFATRAPQRPNPIALSCVRLLGIRRRRVLIADHDLLDGTPVLDLKPYLPYCDSVPDADIGYVASLPVDAGDHVSWWQRSQAAVPQRYADWLGRPTDDAGDQLR
jgi:tRNA (adenine37-N6)-methyltransferase